ncbi:hypothetical protein Q9189_001614 [Teloschistes chrysophthalmus]
MSMLDVMQGLPYNHIPDATTNMRPLLLVLLILLILYYILHLLRIRIRIRWGGASVSPRLQWGWAPPSPRHPKFLRVPAPIMEERELESGRGYRGGGKTLQEAVREVLARGREREREEEREIMLRGGSDGSAA